MNFQDKTKEQLIKELIESQRRIADLESRLPELDQGRGFLRDACSQLETGPRKDLAVVAAPDEILEREVAKRTHLESQLAQSERLYRTLVETCRDVIWTVGMDLRYTYVSPSVTAVLGYSVEEIMGMRPLDGLTPASRERVVKAFQQELELEAAGPREKYTARTEEIERYHKDGSTCWEEITTTFVRDGFGKPIGILGISHDITDRKRMEDELSEARDELERRVEERTGELLRANAQLEEEIRERKNAEDALRDSEQRLELALDGADLGLWDWYVQTGRAVVNRRSAEIVGYALEEIQQSFEFWEGLLHPEDRIRAVETVHAHLEGRTNYYEDEYRAKAKSGEWKWIFSRGKVVEHDPDGKPLRMAGTYRDITFRKQTEETLRQSEERYRTVADFTYDWEYWIDLDGKFLYVSPSCERVTGFAAKEFLDDPGLFEKIVHPDDLALVTTHWQEARKTEATKKYCFDFRIIDRDGKVRWINHACQPVHGEGGRSLGRRACNRDITDRKRAEEALRQSEEKYRLVVDNAQEAILVAQDGVLRFVNPKTVELVSFTEEELVGKPFTDFLYPDDRGMVLDRHMRRLRGEEFESRYAFRVVDKSGAVKWVEIDSALVSWEGRPAALIFMSDITERMRMEESLRESEEWYRTLVEESFDGIFVQKGSQIIFANSRLYEMLGYSTGELEGLDHWKVYHPDYQQITRDRAVARMRGEDVVSQYEVKLQRKDGSTFGGEVSAKAVKVKGEPGVQVWVRDVSKRKHSEEVQRRLATAVEQAVEAIVITDTEGTIQYVNPGFERITGYTRGEAIDQNPRLLKSGEHDQTFYKNLWDTIKRGEVWTGRFINKKKDGSRYHEEATISPVRTSSGRVINYVAVKRDITEHLQLSGQLLHAQKMEAIGTLAGGIAHDFNNLLQVTMGFSELLLQERKKDDPEYADLMKIFQAAKSGADLVQRLLMFSRKVEPKPIPLNLNRKIMQVEKLLRRTIPRMVDINLDLSADLPQINADPSQVEQVLMNLAVNARDAMPDVGNLTVRTSSVTLDEDYCRLHIEANPGEYVVLEVSDTGHGMDKETVEHIFEPFFTTKEIGRGTGLGLAMVYGIVKQHNGHIAVYSEVGHGTSFRVYLPTIPAEVEPGVGDSGVMPAFGTETVLLVDDEDFVRELGARMLSRHGYTVLQAVNGREALDLFEKKSSQISLVILDLIMPEMGGTECLKELLKIDPQVNVLVASGYSADQPTGECIELGAKGFVGKPFKMKELLRQVRKILDER